MPELASCNKKGVERRSISVVAEHVGGFFFLKYIYIYIYIYIYGKCFGQIKQFLYGPF
jgi:hypothetical protein